MKYDRYVQVDDEEDDDNVYTVIVPERREDEELVRVLLVERLRQWYAVENGLQAILLDYVGKGEFNLVVFRRGYALDHAEHARQGSTRLVVPRSGTKLWADDRAAHTILDGHSAKNTMNEGVWDLTTWNLAEPPERRDRRKPGAILTWADAGYRPINAEKEAYHASRKAEEENRLLHAEDDDC